MLAMSSAAKAPEPLALVALTAASRSTGKGGRGDRIAATPFAGPFVAVCFDGAAEAVSMSAPLTRPPPPPQVPVTQVPSHVLSSHPPRITSPHPRPVGCCKQQHVASRRSPPASEDESAASAARRKMRNREHGVNMFAFRSRQILVSLLIRLYSFVRARFFPGSRSVPLYRLYSSIPSVYIILSLTE